MTGCTYRQLDYWARLGWIPDMVAGSGTGSGHRRLWDDNQVNRVRLIRMAAELKSCPLDELAGRIGEGTVVVHADV